MIGHVNLMIHLLNVDFNELENFNIFQLGNECKDLVKEFLSEINGEYKMKVIKLPKE